MIYLATSVVVITGPSGFGIAFADSNTKNPDITRTTVIRTVARVLVLFFCFRCMCGGFYCAFCRYNKPHNEIEQEARPSSDKKCDKYNARDNRVNVEVFGQSAAYASNFSI